MKKKKLLALALVLSIVCLIVVSLATTKAQNTVDIYAKEISSSTYGFGTSSGHETSPGPTLTFNAGESVTVTLHNEGQMAHNFAIVSSKSDVTSVEWNSQIASSSNPVAAGGSASVTFTVGSAGNYYYVCQVDGHASLGMWGNVKVNAAVPEFPSPILLVFGAATVTGLVAYFARINVRRTLKA